MFPIPSLSLSQQRVAITSRNGIGGIYYDLPREFASELFAQLRQCHVWHRDQDHIAEVKRLSYRPGFGERAQAIDKPLWLFRIAVREQDAVAGLDPPGCRSYRRYFPRR